VEFGKIPVADALGAVLGHSVSFEKGGLTKGLLLQAGDIAVLQENGVSTVFAARLGAGDMGENAAADAIGTALAGGGVRVEKAATGRVNLFAMANGLVEIDRGRINQLNRLDESLTISTLLPYERVDKGQMLATIKIIPYAVPKNTMDVALAMIGKAPPLTLKPFEYQRVGLIISHLQQSKDSLIEKTRNVMAERVESMGCELGRISIVEHDANAVSVALNGLIPHHDLGLVFGASAIVDRADVVPLAVSQVGGEIEHLGMPVDPGNLLMLARIGEMPVVGVPTCARSMKLNGFDMVLQRLLAGVVVRGADLMDMGVGGLLKEIASRPRPREGK
jgi:molybdenum cofactor cytidylyltransferase